MVQWIQVQILKVQNRSSTGKTSTGMAGLLYGCCIDLSLYSTRTQNTWRRGLTLGSAPNARILRYPTQNIPTSWCLWRWVTHIFRVLPSMKHKSCVLPDAKSKRKPVEYRLQNSGVGHVHFTFFVSISFALGPVFSVEYGLKAYIAPGVVFVLRW